ncbi:MAG: glutamate-5-semialdehyde dehydrogenase [Leptospiraceae bacterium]|nr:glutamate-5-semialdehyde dehydrogenase [Leptospiraceae bacterium]
MSEIKQYTDTIALRAKKASKQIRTLNTIQKNKFLIRLAAKLKDKQDFILTENSKDIEEGKKKNLSSALLDRLLLNEKRILSLSQAVTEIANLPDPIGVLRRGATLPNGLRLITKQVPLGVVLVIYESRPNVTIDVAALAFKSGNVAILRGGSEAIHSNLALYSIFQETLREENLSEDAIVFVDRTDRANMIPLLKHSKNIDIVVPRGGEALIQFVSENASIPVVKHDKGVCNLFVDESADPTIVDKIVINSKAQRPGVCNALENLIIHKNYSKIEDLLKNLENSSVEILIDEYGKKFLPNVKIASNEDYETEFLDLRLSLKFVDSLDEAIQFIETYSSGHTEAILSNSESNIQKFLSNLDSAALFVNCSTRFHDGGEFGLGAEVGISTGKLHVRGPMGLEHLTTTTTILTGEGQIRN